MPRPDNGLYIILGEVNLLVTAMRRNTRWAAHSHQEDDQDPLINNFSQLKDILNTVADLDNLAPNEFLSPFLEVIRSEDTTGPITGLALTSINKFLSYGLIEATCETTAPAIENIADAVTHARFVGTDPGSDEVVLMKILHVLRTLLLTPAGAQLANESVCEIMQSCFRICFEMRLSELLRKSAEHTLMDMVQLLFSRLPQFKEDAKWASSMRKLKMRAGVIDPSRNKKRRSPKVKQKRSSAGSMTSAGSSSNIAAAQNTGTVYQSSAIEAQSGGAESSPQCPVESVSASAEDTAASPEAPTNSLAETVIPIEDDVSETPADAVTDPSASDVISPTGEEVLEDSGVIATTPMSHGTTVIDIHESFQHASEAEGQEEESCSSMMIEDAGPAQDAEPSQYDGDSTATDTPASTTTTLSVPGQNQLEANEEFDKSCGLSDVGEDGDTTAALSAAEQSDGASIHESEYINPRGVRFMPHQYNKDGTGPIVPYGLPCVQELFRFLISLTNPLDRHNTDVMIHMGLSLLTVALESGADHVPAFNSLTQLVKDDMCRNLFFLLQSERLSLFAASIRVCFLLFEALRTHLKFQLEMYLTKLMDIIVSESPRISYEQREIALESVVQIMRIPGLVTEMYLNYDCDLYCSNLFEDLMKLLSKNAFPVSGLFTTHLLSLDALLAVIDSIEQHCHHRVLHSTKSNSNSDENTTPSEMDPPPRPPTETRIGVMSDTDTVSPSVVAVDITVPPPPPASGFTTAHRMMSGANTTDTAVDVNGKDKKRGPQIRPNRMKTSASIPTEEELVAIKNKKKIYQSGTEQFNVKPSKGIAFLQDQELLATPLDAGEVATFLKENPKLDKKMIGEYISNKKYSQVLEAYQKSFIFDGTRLDQALRMYLETFRLPGESPVIAYLMEHFAEHWHKMNNEPFANADAAFTLGYAIIMLNVDQHNHNAKKQNIPMTVDEFKRNVKNVNGGQDFEQDMLCEIYEAIKNEEIVMPAEHTGLVKENYLWKVLLSRGTTMEGLFLHAPTGSYDRDLFALVWGPTVAALSFVFDKSLDKTIIQKAISGFRKCAMISAHYGMSDVFDNLVISLCKFTTLLSAPESAEMIPIMFGNNMKAQLAAQTVFNLAHRHGDILREGWKNILDCMLQLHRAKMLPEFLVRVEDFVDPTGRISLIREETAVTQRADTGVLSSFYSYFTLTETAQQRGPSPEDQEASRQAQRCIQDCHVEQLITDTKFLRSDALHELLKALIFASRYPEMQETMNGVACEEDASVFFLELLIRVVLQNRDRVAPFWQSIRDHLYSLIVNASEHTFLVERAVVGLLRLAIRLLRRDEVAPQVLASLGMTLLMKPIVIHAVSRQVSYGLHDLLKTNAANIHLAQHWYTLFTLLEVVGAGMNPPPLMQAAFGINIPESISDAGAQSDSEVTSGIGSDGCASERGYTSDSEIYTDSTSKQSLSETCSEVNPEDLESDKRLAPVNQYTIALNEELKHHDQRSLIKSCETLAFLVRDAAHITPHNFESCVHAIRTFVEASLNGGQHAKQKPTKPTHGSREKKSRGNRKKEEERRMKKSRSSPSHLSQQDSDEERETDSYHSLSIQLLDLMHTLHTRAATIFSSWAEAEQETNEEYQQQVEDDSRTDPEVREPYMVETIDAGTSTLWVKCWCPLLQGIARLCCDSRRHVRSQALTYLQRALLVHDLQTLSAMEWESCFNKVLFPLLSRLLEPINQSDPSGVEETQMRASTLLCRVFLQHLTPLKSLSTFTALWLTILEFMDKYMHVDKSDLLCEAIPESLKNMLLVMHTAGILQASDELQQSQLWKLTWDRIGAFLPSLKQEVFKPHELEPQTHSMNRDAGPSSTPVSTATTRASSSPPPQQPASPPSSSPQPTSTPSPTESPVHTSPITNKENSVEGSPPPRPVPPRPESPLASTEGIPAAGTYILHPPLPHVSSPKTSQRGTDLPPGAVPPATVPILLNPDIIKGTNYPIISPQNTPEHQRDASPEGH